MKAPVKIVGTAHTLGSQTVSNRDLAKKLNLKPDWFENRTGIVERRICGPEQDVISIAAESIEEACANAGISIDSLGHETVLIHIQNGFTHLTPPPPILVCEALRLKNVRTFGIDGVCAEPINALEIATMMLMAGKCERVIVSSSVDFIPMVNPNDTATAGLFGAGAGALILEQDRKNNSQMLGLHWETHTNHSRLGEIKLQKLTPLDQTVNVDFSYYLMDGSGLAKTALRVLPKVLDRVCATANWDTTDIDQVIVHQPNAKLLEMGAKKLGLKVEDVYMPVRTLGNMGPASLLVSLSMAERAELIQRGDKLLLMSFGLGFSCGMAALIF